MQGVFLNAGAGFDSKTFRQVCNQNQIQANIKTKPGKAKDETLEYEYFDQELYQRRVVIEPMLGSISFKALLFGFDTLVITWVALHLFTIVVLFLRKINKEKIV